MSGMVVAVEDHGTSAARKEQEARQVKRQTQPYAVGGGTNGECHYRRKGNLAEVVRSTLLYMLCYAFRTRCRLVRYVRRRRRRDVRWGANTRVLARASGIVTKAGHNVREAVRVVK